MAAPTLPEQAEGLLEQIADTALDDDYYVVRAGPYEQSREFNTVLTGAVLAVFALLVAIAVIQTRTDRPATQRERATLISDIESRKTRVANQEATAERLRAQVADLQSSAVGFDRAYEDLRLQATDAAASGPGITVRIDMTDEQIPSVTDSDIHAIVNALWYSGAEAIAVNGQRIGSTSAIRYAGGVIKVNFAPIGPPYVITALGSAKTLDDRFVQTGAGRAWEQRGKITGFSYRVTRSDDLSVKAAPKDRLRITHATAIEGDS